MLTRAKNQEQNNADQTSNENDFIRPTGFKEGDYVRTAASGNYTPTVHQIDHLIMRRELSNYEISILIFIKVKTINFWNTDVRLKRKDIQGQLNIPKPNLLKAIRNLVEKKYIVEVADKDHYYFYALHPETFEKPMVVRSIQDHVWRLNPQEKKRLAGSKKQRQGGSEKLRSWKLKATLWVANSYHESESTFENYSVFQTLKYILLKYILINKLSQAKAENILKILESSPQPELSIKSLANLIDKNPVMCRGIVEELLRADREKTHANTRGQLTIHPALYLFRNWEAVAHHYQNMDHRIPDDSTSVQIRTELYKFILEYPVDNNVVRLNRAL